MSHFAGEVKTQSAGNTCDHNPFCGHLRRLVAHGSWQLPQEQLVTTDSFSGGSFHNWVLFKTIQLQNLGKGLPQSTGTNSAVTLDPGLLHSVTFALMDDVPKHCVHVINAYEWVSTFHSQTKIMPRRRRNQQEHWGREVRGGSFSH